ncbi:lim homeobox protein lhx9-like protein, partial [Lasius niger]
MLKEVGCGSATPPPGDGGGANSRQVGANEGGGGGGSGGGGGTTEGALGCGGCGREIAERWYLKAADRAWHCGCLRCCHCRVPLAAELTCFARDGNIYCKEDYYRPHYELLCCAGDYAGAAGGIEDLGSPGVSPLPAYYEQSPITSSGTVQKGRPRKRKLSEVTGSELPVTMRLAAGAL